MPQDTGLVHRLSKRLFRALVPDVPIPFEVVDHAEVVFPGLYARNPRLDQLDWKWGDLDKEKGLVFLCSLVAAGHTPIVEFGTFRGRTTYNLALNTTDEIYTIDLGSPLNASARHNGSPHLSRGAGVPLRERFARAVSSLTETYKLPHYFPGEVFHSAPEDIRKRIHMILGDSMALDLSHLNGKIGLVIVDGGHQYEVVCSDTQKAFELVKPGGLIVWDDYDVYWPGVIACVNDLSAKHKLYYLKDERFVIHIAN